MLFPALNVFLLASQMSLSLLTLSPRMIPLESLHLPCVALLRSDAWDPGSCAVRGGAGSGVCWVMLGKRAEG